MGFAITSDLAAVAAEIRVLQGSGRAYATHVRSDGDPARQPKIGALQPYWHGDGGPGRHKHRSRSSAGDAPRPVLPARVRGDLLAPACRGFAEIFRQAGGRG